MAYHINENCLNCGACEAACPMKAIKEENGKREIDPNICVECGSCASNCPVGAIEL